MESAGFQQTLFYVRVKLESRAACLESYTDFLSLVGGVLPDDRLSRRTGEHASVCVCVCVCV